ncbi:MAG: putative quinol monooxygenase [Flavobacteriales bacterium]
MEKLTVMAQIIAKEEKRDFVKSELLKLLELTRAEEGCINYMLHQDKQNPNLFVFYENWTSKELLDKHLKSAHIVAYIKNTEGCVDDFILNELQELNN